MAVQEKLRLDKIRSQLGMVNSVQNPILRGQKLAQISSEITAAALGIKAPPFRKSTLAKAISTANPEPKTGVAVPAAVKEEKAKPQRKMKGLSKFGKGLQSGTESFAEWLTPGQGEETIRSNILLSSARGIGKFARKAAIMSNVGAASKGIAARKAADEKLKEVEKAREIAMQKPVAGDSDLLGALEKAQVPKKLDKILEMLEEM